MRKLKGLMPHHRRHHITCIEKISSRVSLLPAALPQLADDTVEFCSLRALDTPPPTDDSGHFFDKNRSGKAKISGRPRMSAGMLQTYPPPPPFSNLQTKTLTYLYIPPGRHPTKNTHRPVLQVRVVALAPQAVGLERQHRP